MNLKEYIDSIKNYKIGVIGIGVSNEPLIRLLCSEGCSVTALDKRTFQQLGNKAVELINLGAKLKLGNEYLDNLDYDIIFRSPSLMPYEPHLIKARENGCIITSEMEVFLALNKCKTIAVTGSDGKTTTTTIISELLKSSGYNVHVGGNIGNPLLCELPFFREDDIVVLELSSFQLHSMHCSPDIAIITNISVNHLDIHKDFEDYVNAKKQIYINQKPGSELVLNADDDILRKLPGTLFFSTEHETNGCYLKGSTIYRCGNHLMDISDILLPGFHNVKNYLAAFTATIGLADDDICKDVALTFKGVEHRLEFVKTVNGISFINDSIGTSPNRTIAGLQAMKDKPIIILGGHDKGIPFDDLANAVVKYAKKAVVTGETREKIAASLNCYPEFEYLVIDDFDSAVIAAYNVAEKGDIVLFSPACSSFDNFKNFEERGKKFKQIVMELL